MFLREELLQNSRVEEKMDIKYAIIKKTVIEKNKNAVVNVKGEKNKKKKFIRVKLLKTDEEILVFPSQLKKISKDEALVRLI